MSRNGGHGERLWRAASVEVRMEKLLLAILASATFASPALAEMALTPAVPAPAMSPLSLVGLATVLGVAGVRILRNRRPR